MNSNAPQSFYTISKIPLSVNEAIQKYPGLTKGTCALNIDGECISGGRLITGTSGYQLASMGYKDAGQKTCAKFPLFYATNVDYMPNGMTVSNNLRPLYNLNPKL